jgi:glycosyltransferase involved in cell wall biosynthesis
VNDRIKRVLINNARNKDRFLDSAIDEALEKVISEFKPDIAHIQHLNHLSLGLVSILKSIKIPIVYTLHDFWLMCPRGQFLQFNNGGEPWKLCDGQEDSKCARICFRRYQTGEIDSNADLAYWSNWVHHRMTEVRKIVDSVDLFVSPSKTVMESFKKYFPSAVDKVIHLDYGFNRDVLSGRDRGREGNLVFGYIGTHIPAKGVDYLIKAFGALDGDPVLRIWGREKGEYTPYLRGIGEDAKKEKGNRIQWMGEYDSRRIVEQVFNRIDCLVVPSIWPENSPLVIHEAQQAGVPVITADTGGMEEYVKDGYNGLLFKFRNIASLQDRMQTVLDNPDMLPSLGKRGYLYSDDGQIPDIHDHVRTIVSLFHGLRKNAN